LRFRQNYQLGNPDHIVALRPAWHGEDDQSGSIKVVITGTAKRPPDGSRKSGRC
jgi:hypothetical protein